jgi:hypothetical protein
MPMRERQEIQEVLWRLSAADHAAFVRPQSRPAWDHRRIHPGITCAPGGADGATKIESLPNAEDHGAIRLRPTQPRSAGLDDSASSVPADLVDPTAVKPGARTTGAGERVAGFAADEHLAPIVGTRTAGQVICSDSKTVGNDFFVRIPGRAWYTPARRLVEGTGIEPDVYVAQGDDASRDPQLDRALEIASSL